MRGIGALSAGAVLGLPPLRGLAAEARVGIVGAGLAGLTAAYELNKAGIAATVFEANTRLGGRCWSIRDVFDQGQIAEQGGEFIDTDHHPIRNLAAELGLQLDDVNAAVPQGAQPLYYFNGELYTLADATRDFQPVYPVLQAQAKAVGAVVNYRHRSAEAIRLDRLSISQWVARYVPGGRLSRLGQLIENAFAEENAADSDQQSALNLVTVLVADKRHNFNLYYTASDQRFHVHGGNDQIPARLAAALPGAIETGMVLLAIAQRGDGRVRLSFARDTGIVDRGFDRVILALPFAVMRAAVDFAEAQFRPLKQQAIRALGMGASVKFQLQFTRRVWYDAGCSGEIRLPAPDFQTSWDVTRAQPGQHGIFNFWSGGAKAALVAGNAETRNWRRTACAAPASSFRRWHCTGTAGSRATYGKPIRGRSDRIRIMRRAIRRRCTASNGSPKATASLPANTRRHARKSAT